MSYFVSLQHHPPSHTSTLSLHDALPIFGMGMVHGDGNTRQCMATAVVAYKQAFGFDAPPYTYQDFEERSEEHTSELQSRENLVCRLLLEKKKLFILFFRLDTQVYNHFYR